MRRNFDLAVRNISRWGDTDVFPFAPENHILHDKTEAVVECLLTMHSNFADHLSREGPSSDIQLQLVTNEGFRWANQLDPMWNAYLLGIVIHAAERIEQERIPLIDEVVFSYRFSVDQSRSTLFTEGSWRSFIDKTEEYAAQYAYVVVADIADFYSRIYHHRIENSLKALDLQDNTAGRVIKVLGSLSGGVSFGLPVGGPAARLLSEIALNRVDRLLRAEGVVFCRFADDYRLFANSQSQAYEKLITLADLLHSHEGATLQKQKTRVLRARDFLRAPLFLPQDSPELTAQERQEKQFMRLSLRFDPYSPNAELDYARLQEQLSEFDILQMLADEVAKSRINVPVVRRLAQAIGYVDGDIRDAAVATLVDNLELLAPALPVVLRVLDDLMADLSEDLSRLVAFEIRRRISDGDYYLQLPINMAYAFRVLRHDGSNVNLDLAARIFQSAPPSLQRDIVIHMHNWRADWFISNQRRQYANLHPWVKRATLLSSYLLNDEGSHWRRSLSLNAFDTIARDWRAEQVQTNHVEIPV